MKKIFSITIALCLIFCSILPVYAEAWTSQQAQQTNQSVIGILSMLTQFRTDFMNWATLTQSGSQGLGFTFQDIAVTLAHIDNWFAPVGSNSMGGSLVELVANIGTIVANYMPSLPAIESYVASWMSSNNTSLLRLTNALGRMAGWSTWDVSQNAHHMMFPYYQGDTNYEKDWYTLPMINPNGGFQHGVIGWSQGSPLGNIALLIHTLSNNQILSYHYRWAADLTHYNDNLTTWDSQGSTLTQVGFTPDSAIQGLYRYLAFTQRDVARLAYVFANDEELEARELAQANQEQVLDDFINPTGTGTVSTTDLGSMADASGSFKDNFNTGQSASGIWNVFDRDYDWFSQTTANNLQPSLTRGSEEYPTPYLDEYYKELDSILEVNKRD